MKWLRRVFIFFSAVALIMYVLLSAHLLTYVNDRLSKPSNIANIIRQLPVFTQDRIQNQQMTDPKQLEMKKVFNAYKERRNETVREQKNETVKERKNETVQEQRNETVKERRNETIQERSNETVMTKDVYAGTALKRNNVTSRTRSQKYLIYVCHRRPFCGGWSDRQRGLVSAFILSLATVRKFGIVMDNPCNLTHFYVPSHVNWVIPAAELENKTQIVINDMGSKAGIPTKLKTKGFNEYFPQDVVYIKTNAILYVFLAQSKRYAQILPTWTKVKQSHLVFAHAWKIMMKPSQYLQNRLDGFLQSIGYEQRTHPLVCSHVRIGKSATLKSDGRVRMNVSDITVLWDFLDKYVQNGSKVFLATDNFQVRTWTRHRFKGNMSDTGGTIIHMDRWRGSVNEACRGFGDGLLDQLILTKCDVLVLTKSGFGMRAAFVRGEAKGLFSLDKRKVRKIHM